MLNRFLIKGSSPWRTACFLGMWGLSASAMAQAGAFVYASPVQPIRPPVSAQAGMTLQGAQGQAYPQATSILAQRPGVSLPLPQAPKPIQAIFTAQAMPLHYGNMQVVQQVQTVQQVYYPVAGGGYVAVEEYVSQPVVYVTPASYPVAYYQRPFPAVGYIHIGNDARHGRTHRPPAFFQEIAEENKYPRYR